MGWVLTWGCAPQWGETPLWSAAQNGHDPVVRVLVVAGADKNAPNTVRKGRVGRGVGPTN